MKQTTYPTKKFLHLFILIILFPPIQSTLSHTSLLEQICRQSPHYLLCTMTLRLSINHRSNEDIVGFARLALRIVNVNATRTLDHIKKGFMQITCPMENEAMKDCLASYNMIVNVHLHEALNALNKRDYKIVKQRAYVAGIQAETCDNKFKNSIRNPLKDTNRYVQNLCAIIMSIINKLMLTNQPTFSY